MPLLNRAGGYIAAPTSDAPIMREREREGERERERESESAREMSGKRQRLDEWCVYRRSRRGRGRGREE